jgi:hypothetical protein
LTAREPLQSTEIDRARHDTAALQVSQRENAGSFDLPEQDLDFIHIDDVGGVFYVNTVLPDATADVDRASGTDEATHHHDGSTAQIR